MSFKNMTARECSDKEKDTIIATWRDSGADASTLYAIQEELSSDNSAWQAVYLHDKPMAIFDVRQVPQHAPLFHKSMRIYFAPQIGVILDDGAEFQEVEKAINTATGVLAYAFGTLIAQAEATPSKLCKIYCEHPFILSIYQAFLQTLIKDHSDEFSGKFYGRWLEIQTK